MRSRSAARGRGLAFLLVSLVGLWTAGAVADGGTVAALGRIEPRDGVARLSGPARPVVVVAKLEVGEGARVEAGQVLATLDSHRLNQARVAEALAVLDRAQRESKRAQRLGAVNASSRAKQEDAEMDVNVARARLEAARAELDHSLVRAPFAGQVLAIHAREGERLGPDGLLELGRTDEMFVVAEVYETDVHRVAVGQKATMRSPALPEPLSGTVEHIGLRVGKMDVLGTDPVAKTDARVVEVEIRLDDAEAAAVLTNLQVKVEIQI